MPCYQENERMKHVYLAFQPYIAESQYFDILFSEKFGYIMVTYEEWNPFVRINSAEELLKMLYYELVRDVVSEKGQTYEIYDKGRLSAWGKTECRRKVFPYLDSIEDNAEFWALFEDVLNYY